MSCTEAYKEHIACMRSNLRYGKNQKREDVKSHHYIISFDPRDAPDNGLTVDRAQALGEQFCKEHFPGHQALVCTHPDGHNHSGNIHVHIVINSLRIAEVPLLPYMERPADTSCQRPKPYKRRLSSLPKRKTPFITSTGRRKQVSGNCRP